MFFDNRAFYDWCERCALAEIRVPLVAGMAELDEALVIEPQPRDAACLGRRNERGRARAERARLCKADEVVARRFELPVVAGCVGLQIRRQQALQQRLRELAGREPHVAVAVGEDHVVQPGLALQRTRAAEGHLDARHALQLERHVLHDVPHPGAVILTQATQEAARLAVAAAVLGKARQCLQQRPDEGLAELYRRPVLELAQVEHVANDGEVGVDTRSHVNVG